jgi:two-component system, sensor histidine kinase PdtaS
VHETLSQDSRQRVSFEKIASRIVDMLADGLVDPDLPIAFELEGSPGDLSAEVATPLALVLTELLQNSVEHAFAGRTPPGPDQPVGTVRVVFERRRTALRVLIEDDGVGLPAGQSLEGLANLGLHIARTLVETELGGTFEALEQDRGTAIELLLPLP